MSSLAPGSESVAQFAVQVYKALDNVKVYREQCRDLANKCVQLESAIRENTDGVESNRALDAAEEVSAVILTIRSRLLKWSKLNLFDSLVQQGDIKQKIDGAYQDINLCMHKFNIGAAMDLNRSTQYLAQLQARDYAELREELSTIKDNINTILQMHRPEVESMMQTLQVELQNEPERASSAPADREISHDIQEGLYRLHKAVNQLPPLPDLTGQVVRESTEPVASGAINDVYRGTWLGEEKVALKFPRAINYATEAKKQFLQDVDVWRRLQSPNVVRLYGVVYFGERLFTVSPWMDNGSAIEYVNTNPYVTRSKILEGVVLGMEYLHFQKFVHGDLRGANVLIDSSGRARLSDFGFSKILEQVTDHPHTSSTGHTEGVSIRWAAPELVEPDPITGKSVSVSHYTDSWSFGMLCLELMTGERPYSHCARDVYVAMELLQGRLPERPGEPAVSRGLDDALWDIMLHCWKKPPVERPTMTKIKEMLRSIPHGPSPSPAILQDTPISHSPGQVPAELPMTPSSLPKTNILPSTPISMSPAAMRQDMSNGSSFSLSPQSARRDTTDRWNNTIASSANTLKPTSQLLTPPKTAATISSPISHGRSSSLGEHSTTPRPASGLSKRPANSHVNALELTTPAGRSSSELVSPLEQIKLRKFSGASNTSRPSLGDAPNRTRPMDIPGRPSTAPASKSTDSFHFGSSSSMGSNLPPIIETLRRTPSIAPSVSSSASSQSLIEAACQDPDPYIRLSTDGALEAGTLEGLISRMFAGRTVNTGLRDTLLITYRLFTNSQSLLEVFIRRYSDTESDDIPAERRANLRWSILDVLRNWFQKRYVEKDVVLLERAKEFCRSVRNPSALQELAAQVSAVTDQRIRVLGNPLSPPMTPSVKKTVPQNAYELAVALTVMEGDRFKAILPGECVAYIRRRPENEFVESTDVQNSVDVALTTNKRITAWVKKSVLYCEDLEERIARLKFMCNTAAECRRLRNYSSMWAIWSALQSPALARLSLTRKGLNNAEQRTLKDIDEELDWPEHHKAYRSLLDPNRPCVPYLDWHLRDFRSVYSKYTATVEAEGHICINFARCAKLAEAITAAIGHFKPPDLPRNHGSSAYLESQLKRVSGYTTGDFEAKSLQVQAEENDERVLNRKGLESMGFLPRKSRPQTAR